MHSQPDLTRNADNYGRIVQDGARDSDLVAAALMALRAPDADIPERAAARSVIEYLATAGVDVAGRLQSSFGDQETVFPRQDFADACRTVRAAAAKARAADCPMPPQERLTEAPRLFYWSQVLAPAERLYLSETARPRLQTAGVRNRTDRRLEHNEQRVAEQCALGANDPLGLWLERRLAHQLGLDIRTAEPLTIVRYPEGGHFAPHCDAVHPLGHQALHPSDMGGTRIASIILYLNDDYTGGETAFVRRRLKVSPRAGDGIAFFNHRPDGEVDLETMHAALPVERGEKWVALLWFRENAVREIDDELHT